MDKRYVKCIKKNIGHTFTVRVVGPGSNGAIQNWGHPKTKSRENLQIHAKEYYSKKLILKPIQTQCNGKVGSAQAKGGSQQTQIRRISNFEIGQAWHKHTQITQLHALECPS